MAESKDYLELSFKSINCFANDGKLDVFELQSLLDIALRDGVVDINEKRVLENIFERLTNEELSGEMQAKIAEIKKAHF